MKYKLSIVTPSFNQGKFIKDCIDSVRKQNYPDIEHIIIDALSNDDTLNILKSNKNLRWMSEKDTGAANALNKGFRLTQGDVLAWLNCDDFYYENVLGDVMEIFNNDEKIMIVYGNVDIIDEEKNLLYSQKTEHFDLNFLIHKNADVIRQAGVFFKRELLDRIGFINESLKCAFDYELFIRMLKVTNPVYIDIDIAAQREYDNTLTRRFLKRQGVEIIKTSLKNGGKIYDYIVLFNIVKKILKIK